MPSRSVRRRRNKALAAVGKLPTHSLCDKEATRLLLAWRQEARRRAGRLGAPAAWALADSPAVQALAARLDRSGELLAELRRACAEAVAAAAGRHLVRGSRPRADRKRRPDAESGQPEGQDGEQHSAGPRPPERR
jgi:hypothetical protein